MSARHFTAIAASIKAQRLTDNPLLPVLTRTTVDQQLDALARELADRFASTNSRFNRDRFLAACGVTG